MTFIKNINIGSLFLLLYIMAAGLFLPAEAIGEKDLKTITNQVLNKKWTGDFDQMVERRIIRILIPYSKTFYFIDKGTQRGASYEIVKKFEKTVNEQLRTRHLKVHFLFIPTARERLISSLTEGLGDIAVGNLTITDKRQQLVDFSDPFGTGVNEILVTGQNRAPVNDIMGLSDKEIHVRKSSSYYESLRRVNKVLSGAGKSKIKIVEANDNLEDEDLLEMVNAGLIPGMVIDSHKGQFWARIFKNIKLHTDIKFRENSHIAWAIRKDCPEFKMILNRFVKDNKKGTLMGNMIFNRYLKNIKYVKNNLADKDRKRFYEAGPYFKKYADMYNFDELMLAALAYQESTIDQSKRSHAGAIGVMQILPTTANDKNVNIPEIEEIGANIHAGTKYLRFILDRYFNDPGIEKINQVLLTFAAYNAGPAKIKKLQKEAKSIDLNPNIWFKNVEIIAAKRIGRETVQYVSNIFKYYIAYTLSPEPVTKEK